MGQNEMIGVLIGGLLVLGSLFAMFMKCIKPINDLNINIVKLTDAIERLTTDYTKLEKRVSIHGNDIDELKISHTDHEHRIRTLEGGKTT